MTTWPWYHEYAAHFGDYPSALAAAQRDSPTLLAAASGVAERFRRGLCSLPGCVESKPPMIANIFITYNIFPVPAAEGAFQLRVRYAAEMASPELEGEQT